MLVVFVGRFGRLEFGTRRFKVVDGGDAMSCVVVLIFFESVDEACENLFGAVETAVRPSSGHAVPVFMHAWGDHGALSEGGGRETDEERRREDG